MSAIIFYSSQIGKSSRKLAPLSTAGIRAVCSGNEPIPADTDLIFRWGCISKTGKNDAKFVNTIKAIDWCCDKKKARLEMQAAGVPVPQTWTGAEFVSLCLQEVLDTDADKFVVRPEHHTQGKQLFVGDVTAAALTANNTYRDGYVSEYVEKVAEYRVFVVQGRVAWVNKTEDPGDGRVAWNYADGENVYWGEWPVNVVQAALAAAKVAEAQGITFCAVDLMVTADGAAYVSELNSAPSQEGTYHPTCVAKCFDYIVANGKDSFPDVVLPEGTAADRAWRWFIHPAVSDRANIGR